MPEMPKASIGNYKGVMLCNRPNEFGMAAKPERVGLEPFNSRVVPAEPLGWNPAAKLQPRVAKKKGKFNKMVHRISESWSQNSSVFNISVPYISNISRSCL